MKGREGDWCPHMTCLHDAPAGKLVSQPLQNWKDVHEISRSHSQCQYHKSAVGLADNFIKTREAPATDVVHCLDSALCRKEQEARKALVCSDRKDCFVLRSARSPFKGPHRKSRYT